jgi:hypothetical protein
VDLLAEFSRFISIFFGLVFDTVIERRYSVSVLGATSLYMDLCGVLQSQKSDEIHVGQTMAVLWTNMLIELSRICLCEGTCNGKKSSIYQGPERKCVSGKSLNYCKRSATN